MARFTTVPLPTLVLSTVGAVVAIADRLPAEFGGPGDPNNVAGEFLSRGTALSPPLVPMVLQVVFTVLATARRRWWGTLGVAGLTLLGLLYLIGGLGEGFWPDRFNLFEKLLQFLGLVSALLMLGLGLLALLPRRRPPRPGQA
jgi:hypothetical protein